MQTPPPKSLPYSMSCTSHYRGLSSRLRITLADTDANSYTAYYCFVASAGASNLSQAGPCQPDTSIARSPLHLRRLPPVRSRSGVLLERGTNHRGVALVLREQMDIHDGLYHRAGRLRGIPFG